MHFHGLHSSRPLLPLLFFATTEHCFEHTRTTERQETTEEAKPEKDPKPKKAAAGVLGGSRSDNRGLCALKGVLSCSWRDRRGWCGSTLAHYGAHNASTGDNASSDDATNVVVLVRGARLVAFVTSLRTNFRPAATTMMPKTTSNRLT